MYVWVLRAPKAQDFCKELEILAKRLDFIVNNLLFPGVHRNIR